MTFLKLNIYLFKKFQFNLDFYEIIQLFKNGFMEVWRIIITHFNYGRVATFLLVLFNSCFKF